MVCLISVYLAVFCVFPDCSEWLARQLYRAVEKGDISKVKDLLGQGADPNHQLYWSEEWIEQQPLHYPPLHIACWEGNLDIVKILVSNGADIDRGGGKCYKTPLHWACAGGNKQLVDYLVSEAGCNVGKLIISPSCELFRLCQSIIVKLANWF